MAIVRGPALSLEASGNLGSICYSRWRNLQIARGVWTGTDPNTTKQQVIRAFMTAVTQAWGGTLTADQRALWVDAAREQVWKDRLGSTLIPTGYMYFCKLNLRRRFSGQVIMVIPPARHEWVYVGGLGVVSATGQIRMRLYKEVGVNVTSYGTEFWRAGPYDSGGRGPIGGEWRFISLRVPPGYYYDNDVVIDKFYWYRGRQVGEFGTVGNWFVMQIQHTG